MTYYLLCSPTELGTYIHIVSEKEYSQAGSGVACYGVMSEDTVSEELMSCVDDNNRDIFQKWVAFIPFEGEIQYPSESIENDISCFFSSRAQNMGDLYYVLDSHFIYVDLWDESEGYDHVYKAVKDPSISLVFRFFENQEFQEDAEFLGVISILVLYDGKTVEILGETFTLNKVTSVLEQFQYESFLKGLKIRVRSGYDVRLDSD